MAARFTHGASVAQTRNISQAGKSPAVQKNSMKGMPGRIKTGQDTSSSGLASSAPVGPRFNMGTSLETTKRTVALRSQGAYIGKRGAPHRANKQNGGGSTDKSYRATSTGPAGRITNSGKMESLKGRAKTSWER